MLKIAGKCTFFKMCNFAINFKYVNLVFYSEFNSICISPATATKKSVPAGVRKGKVSPPLRIMLDSQLLKKKIYFEEN